MDAVSVTMWKLYWFVVVKHSIYQLVSFWAIYGHELWVVTEYSKNEAMDKSSLDSMGMVNALESPRNS